MKRSSKLTDNVLNHLFLVTEKGGFATLYEMEVRFGLTGTELRYILEDLKEEELAVESTEGFQISPRGINYGKTRWV